MTNFPFSESGNIAAFPSKKGEMAELIRKYKWAETSIGKIEDWPLSLKTLVNMMLSSRHPMYLMWGNDFVQIYNDAYRKLLGINGKHPYALGKKAIECWAEIWDTIYPLIQEVLAGGSTWNEDQLIPIFRNGRVEDVYWTYGYSAVSNDEGIINGVLVICNETTQKELSDKHIARQITNLFIQAPVAICILRGSEYVIEMINEQMVEMWDRKKEEVINRPAFEVLPELNAQGFKKLLDGVFTTGERFVAQESPINLKRNGVIEKAFVKFVYEPLREEDGSISGVMALAHEVTDLVLARKKIEYAEQKARIAIESAALGVYEINMVSKDLIADKRFFEVFGFDEAVCIDKIITVLHPEDAYTRKQSYHNALKTGKLHYEARVIYKDKCMHWLNVYGKLFYDENNKEASILGVVDDITEQKLLERQKDDFISLASHELKTPLTIIKVYGELAEKMVEKAGDTAMLNMLRKMGGQLKKLTSLIDNLLDITRIKQDQLIFEESLFYFDEFVSEVVEDMQHANASYTIHKYLHTDCYVFSDRERLGQVLTNLISNAIKYSPGTNKLEIHTALENNGVLLSVKDFGIGISAENLTNIFKQFYRVDNKYGFSGMGIGLYISSEIIKRLGGKIWVESALEQGSIFYVWLPLDHRKSNNENLT